MVSIIFFSSPFPKMEVSYDTEFVKELCRLADIGRIPAGTLGEREKRLDHGTMVPLYFVGQYWKGYHLVRIGLSGLPLITHYELGQCIQKASESLGRKTVLIGSGDLSHRLKEDGPYGYREEGPAIYLFLIPDIFLYSFSGQPYIRIFFPPQFQQSFLFLLLIFFSKIPFRIPSAGNIAANAITHPKRPFIRKPLRL